MLRVESDKVYLFSDVRSILKEVVEKIIFNTPNTRITKIHPKREDRILAI
jgi:hypothetical protein